MKVMNILILCLLTMSAIPGSAAQNKVVLAASEYPPYMGEKLPGQGFITEIIVTAFERVDYEVEVKFFPWARGLEKTKEGHYDGMIGIWQRKEREQWFVFSAPLPPNEIGFYKRVSETIPFERFEDLKPYKIGVVRGYGNPPGFAEADYLKKSVVTDDAQNLKMVALGRIDLALVDRALAQYLIDTKLQDYKNVLEWMDPPLETVDQHLGISKKVANYQQKLADFGRGLKLITEDKTLAASSAKDR